MRGGLHATAFLFLVVLKVYLVRATYTLHMPKYLQRIRNSSLHYLFYWRYKTELIHIKQPHVSKP